jgi:hypothetical protein
MHALQRVEDGYPGTDFGLDVRYLYQLTLSNICNVFLLLCVTSLEIVCNNWAVSTSLINVQGGFEQLQEGLKTLHI